MLTKKSLLKAAGKEQVKSPVIIELKELLCSSGEAFIYNAFNSILYRSPDTTGKYNYLSKLKKGELTREDIILLLRFSNEGKKAGVKIIGLRKSIFLHRFIYKHKLKKFAEKLKTVISLLKTKYQQKNTAIQFSDFSATEYAEFEEHFRGKKYQQKNTAIQFSDFSATEYAEFEERFRGTEEDIKIKLDIYTPAVSTVLEMFGKQLVKAVDLGCGRGEWLEILKEHGVSAMGVEINDVFLKRLKGKNLSAVRSDVFDFFKKTEDESFHIVSGFHIIEHIDSGLRVRFLREVLRILKLGGICILETPNPRNILVGSGDFYRDPSHVTPLFPDTIQFTGKTIGFSDSTSFFIEKEKLVEIDTYQFDLLESYVSVSRDFAWIGKKMPGKNQTETVAQKEKNI